MKFLANRSISTGLAIALFTVLSALIGAPSQFSEFTVPVWDILLQFNICTGFVFIILGVLETVETPIPDLRSALKLLTAAFFAYGAGCLSSTAPIAMPETIQLFLFVFSMACLVAGWAHFGLSILRQFDEQS